LLAIPAILGAGGFKLYSALAESAVTDTAWAGLLLGGVAAALVGVLAIKGLLAVIARGKLKIFGVYCAAIGAAAIVFSAIS
jgi:undecaprenyl-diphosphatase